ncbi:hypothetical protein Cs7R123_67810 [Catellatospora sp. TT07R-123]|uniref:DUF6232 family protein n=1 Tax=Catellatospora sp. TT07R-123 TaxID=2733863 RepID=UPI001B1A64B1|nr:DUF6232 family protein [Catellatospora sp. TT07R-123]GHJ49439.1 hypothetical protein Cs7R123_67810 [Catellatospora sp. TT07R-123]
MITYYRDDTVLVTSSYVHIGDRRLRLDELRYVWHQQVRPDWRVRSRTARRGILNLLMILSVFAGFVLLVAFAAAAYGESQLSSAVGRLHVPRNTLLLLAAVLVALGAVPAVWEWMLHRVDDSYDRGDAIHEIWAQTAAGQIMLLRLDDATRFGKIYRALERALDQ